MVEGTSEVVNRVPGDDTPATTHISGGCGYRPKDVLAGIRLVLKPNGYSVYCGERGWDSVYTDTDFSVKGLRVLPGPIYLGPDTGEVGRVGHD